MTRAEAWLTWAGGGWAAAWLALAAGAVFLAALWAMGQGRGRRRAEAVLTQARIAAAAAEARAAAQRARLSELTEERDNLADALHRARQESAALERAR